MRCAVCGTMLAPGIRFCGGCGTAVQQPSPAFCTACGAPLAPGTRFCAACGASAGQPAAGQAPRPAPIVQAAPVAAQGGTAVAAKTAPWVAKLVAGTVVAGAMVWGGHEYGPQAKAWVGKATGQAIRAQKPANPQLSHEDNEEEMARIYGRKRDEDGREGAGEGKTGSAGGDARPAAPPPAEPGRAPAPPRGGGMPDLSTPEKALAALRDACLRNDLRAVAMAKGATWEQAEALARNEGFLASQSRHGFNPTVWTATTPTPWAKTGDYARITLIGQDPGGRDPKRYSFSYQRIEGRWIYRSGAELE